MKRVGLILVALVLSTGCASVGTGGSSSEPTHIYKVDHRLTTTNGVQTYEKEVVKVPYTP